ncbi:MAG: hypothetical protein KJ902_04305 [Candidatus Omnitrophica bacterium]|nr:hypothetical protein [Candidatus Omnitrophota bacterium]
MLILAVFNVNIAHAAIIDTYEENFDTRQDDATINGVDSWIVDQGEGTSAIAQDSTTYTGSGKALELVGATPAANVSRSAAYGDLSPCWLEFIVNPGIGAKARSVPSGKIAAVNFDYTGKVYASTGSSWRDTGETFTAGEWYRIILKLNFATHLYNIYIENAAVPEVGFIPDKENLNFIDSNINSLSQIGFEGVYNITRTDDSYIDDLVVHFIDRLEMITASQALMQDQPSNPVTVQLQNSYSEPQTAWRDVTLELRSSSDKGEFSLQRDEWKPINQVIIPENAQQASFYYKDSKIGTPIITANEYPDSGWEEAFQQAKIISMPAYFDVVVITPQVAGEYFNVEIIAKDDDGEVNELYNGEIEILANYISPYSGAMQITPDNAFGFNKGRIELELLYPDCGIIEVIAQDKEEPSKTGYSGEVLFIPAGFSVSADGLQVVNRAFQVGVSGLNAQGRIAPNYQGPSALSPVYISPDTVSGGAITPQTISAGGFQDGLAEVNVKYNRWGAIRIKAYDEAYPAKTGLSEVVSFVPGGLLVELESPPSERDFFYTGETFEISISVIDEEKNPIPNYQGKINISSTLGLDLPGEYQFMEVDQGRKTFLISADSPGFYAVAAEDEGGELKGESPKIEVRQATIQVVSTFAPVGTTEVLIQLVDEEGNIITSENELTMQVGLQEEYDNSSSSSSATQNPVTFNKGVARILVSNTQAEMVAIAPKSLYDFKIKKGTVTFGRIAKTGIGSLMWREIKDYKNIEADLR